MSDSQALLSSNRPYLLRAIYDWILDNNLTPQILVDANQANVQVPQQHVKDGQILLNISLDAINNLVMDNTHVSFSARFSGRPMLINAPISAILAIFARENGQGMAFPDEPELEQALIEEMAVLPEIDVKHEAVEKSTVETDSEEKIHPHKEENPIRSKPSLKIVK